MNACRYMYRLFGWRKLRPVHSDALLKLLFRSLAGCKVNRMHQSHGFESADINLAGL